MILLLPAWVNYNKKRRLMSSRGQGTKGAARYWMKSTVGGMSDGTIVP